VETSFKEDKQGLGLTKRTKKRFAAHQMVLALGTLAHNVLVWARAWLAPHVPALAHDGLRRLVRDVFHMSGLILRDPTTGRVLVMVAPNATLKGSSDGSFSASDVPNLIVDQAGDAVSIAFPTDVPYQNSVTGSSTTPGLVLVSFHDRL